MTEAAARRREAAAWAIVTALTLVLFHGTLRGLFARWTDWEDGTYSHGLLVPLFSLFLLVEGRDRLKAAPARPSSWGIAVLAGAILTFFAGRLGNMLFAQAIALIAVIAGLVLLAGGWAKLRAAAAPVAFLIFMCPLPSGLYDSISADLRLLASSISTVLLQLAHISAYREGNIIYLPGAAPMSVEDACSGIRSLFGIVATAAAFAVIVRGGVVRKAALVVSAAPIAVFSNILRVTGTGLLQCSGNERLAHGFYHYLGGWVFYVLALALLFGEYLVLGVVFPLPKGSAGGTAPGAAEARQ
jgi:exosortase